MENLTVNILGTEYKIYFRNEKDDDLLDGKGRDGYTDMSAHEIIVCNKKDDCELRDYENWKKNILRHEIVHAFLKVDLILRLPIFMEHGLRTKKWLIGLQFNLQRFLKYSKNLI